MCMCKFLNKCKGDNKGMNDKVKHPKDSIPENRDREQDAILQKRIEATVELALTKALNPVMTTLQEATKAAAGVMAVSTKLPGKRCRFVVRHSSNTQG